MCPSLEGVFSMLELAIVVPTFKERDNIVPLLDSLDRVLQGTEYEVIFVDDDSPDGTANAVRQISLQRPNVRVLQRLNRRGLASACVEGMMSTAAPYIAVMDADLQHDESILPEMLRMIRATGVDLVVASRNVEGGSMGEFAQKRVAVSDLGRKVSRIITRTDVSDPMSGFFMMDRRFVEEVAPDVSAIGFKILLDMISSARRPITLREIPYRFRNRVHGESKLDVLVLVEYLQLVADKLVGHWIPPRFILFSAVGAVGAGLYLLLLYALYHTLQLDFRLSLVISTIAAMTSNFLLNNMITYRDRRLKGGRLISGLLTFYLACSVGAVVAIWMSELMQQSGIHWFLAGVTGVVMASIWNYSMTQFFTWRINRRLRFQRVTQERPLDSLTEYGKNS
jgi:dolichol-phosphate mannosyltransferase